MTTIDASNVNLTVLREAVIQHLDMLYDLNDFHGFWSTTRPLRDALNATGYEYEDPISRERAKAKT